MNIIIAHGFAHRLLSNQIIESAPVHMVDGKLETTDAWQQHGPEGMDLTGGDFDLIFRQLEMLSYVFSDNQARLVQIKPMMPVSVVPEVVPM